MYLATVFFICLFGAGRAGVQAYARVGTGLTGSWSVQQATQQPAPSDEPKAQTPPPAQTQTGQPSPPDATGQTKPPAHKVHHKRKTTPCSNTPAASNSATGAASKPCPPPKKVIRNGGSDEPSIQLLGGTNGDPASQQRSTEQLAAATEDNLKKLAGRQLTAGQQDMVSQVKQFMDQSKTAVAAGDLERGHNLARKAHLLSEELLKP